MNIALFPGSFDPFTVGHADIVRRALPLFDRLIIAVGINPSKHGEQTAVQRVESIATLYRKEPRIEVRSYSSLTVDFASECGARYIVRGVRSPIDFEYERNMAEVNRRLSGVETVILCADPALAYISSSLVRELEAFGRDVSEYLPSASDI